jgi:hypothetical protein
LLFAEKVDNELLVVLDKVIIQALVSKILAKMLSPKGVEGVQQGKFRALAIVQAN